MFTVYKRFFTGLQQDFKVFFFWCIVFMLMRWSFIAAFASQLNNANASELAYASLLGLRLSLKTGGILLLLSWFTSTFPFTCWAKYPHVKVRLWVQSACGVFFSVCFLGRFPYYKIFNQAYNLMLVNGVHDDKFAILDTAIKEYGLLYRTPLALLLAYVLYRALRLWLTKTPTLDFSNLQHKKLIMALTLPVLVVMWIFCRYGGAFNYKNSVNWESAGRTKSNLLNEAILDDGQALYRTYALKKDLDKVNNVEITVAELRQRIAQAGGNPEAKSVDAAFLRTVQAPKIATQPQQIVLVVGESFGVWPQLPKFSKLGITPEIMKIASEPNAASIATMLPHGSGTAVAVNGLVTGMPDGGLYENYQPESFKSKYQAGLAYVMKQLGYKTVFWYGGFSTWEGSKKFTLAQSFDEYHCADEINYTGGTSWGAPDGDLFNAVAKYLDQQQEKTFCVILTTTNHPPYTLDVVKEGFPLEEVKAKLPPDISKDKNTLNELGHIWYADKTMGQFAQKRLQAQPSSLVILTGDHSERFTFAKEEDIRTLSVIPCVFYGQGIRQELFGKDSRGCHMQLAGTLAELYGPRGFQYVAYMPNIFSNPVVWNHKLYMDEKLGLLKDNAELDKQAKNLRSIAAWRVLKGDRLLFHN